MNMIKKVRLSIGTAIQLGLETGTSDPYFTTAFLMTYWKGKCEANCAFCPQARESTSASDRLSRISWPEYDFEEVISTWSESGKFTRVCIQTINYPRVVDDAVLIASILRGITRLPISVAIHPIDTSDLQRLKDSGVTSIGIALDASTASLFEEIKGEKRSTMYRWKWHIQGLGNALLVFGKGNVTTHLIIGLGETEKEAADFIFRMYEMGISVGLFAFTSIKGTSLERRESPELSSYRRIQIVRQLISQGSLSPRQIRVMSDGRIALDTVSDSMYQLLSSGEAFQVTGCKGCNRPYYNERPSGPMYNYPRPLSKAEIATAIRDSGLI
jgi:biotin synthase-related radical SAM superfamily protein